MPYFLFPDLLQTGATISMEGEEAAHMVKGRRVRPGERFALQDGEGRRFQAELLDTAGRRVTLRVLEPLPLPPPPPLSLHLLQAAVKEKAAEWIVQKATELGVAQVSFFPAANSSLARRQLEAPRAMARWERIAREACKQCDRQWPPRIFILPDLPAAVARSTQSAQPTESSPPSAAAWLLDPRAERSAAQALAGLGAVPAEPGAAPLSMAGEARPPLARLLVGPEGGFTEEEAALARREGFMPVRMGGLTLRAETAALSACALLLLGR